MQKSNVYWERETAYEKLAYLLSSDISVMESLKILDQQEMILELSKGKAFSEIIKGKKLAQHIVSRLVQGEKTGSLAFACADIALTLKKEKEIKNKIIIAVSYPAVLFVVTAGIVVFLIAYIFPKMMPLFMGMKATLPFTTKTVIWISNSFMHFWWMYLLFGVGTIVFFFFQREFFLYNLPIIKGWYIQQKIAKYFSRIGSYIDSGIGLDEATYQCAEMEDSKKFRKVLSHISLSIQQGIQFSYSIKNHKIFPIEISSMISVGENSGKLPDMCKKIGEQYEKKFSDHTKVLTSSIEPIAMLGMGFVVGFIALSMITPLYSITQNVR